MSITYPKQTRNFFAFGTDMIFFALSLGFLDLNIILPSFADRLYLLCPIWDGWGVIGRSDKFLSPAAVEILERAPGRLLLRMRESGPLLIWNRCRKLSLAAGAFSALRDNLWLADIEVGQRDLLIQVASA